MVMLLHDLLQLFIVINIANMFVQLTAGFENLLMSHSSWFAYASTMRIYKHYHLLVSDKATTVHSMSFSSYPGLCLLLLLKIISE